ncbi:MAG: helix-turn-helix domain-containing protein [Solirubrobacterales bacterium]
MIRIRSLLDRSQPGLTVRACPDDLDRWIRWARVIEDADVLGQLTGGELVVTGGRWRCTVSDGDRYVCALATRGVAALVMAPQSEAGIPDDVVAACERWRVVLLELSPDATCEAAAEAANALIMEARCSDLVRSLQRERAFLSAIGTEHGPRAVLDVLAAHCGVPIWLISRGAVFCPTGQRQPPMAHVRAVVEKHAAGGNAIAVSMPDGTEASAFAAPSPQPGTSPVGRLVCEMPAEKVPVELRLAIDQTLTFLAVELSLVSAGRAARRPCGAEFVGRLSSGVATPDELEAWARAVGVDLRGHVVCLVVRVPDAKDHEIAEVAAALEDLADSVGAASIVVTEGEEVGVFVFSREVDGRETDRAIALAQMLIGTEMRHGGVAFGTSSVIAKETADVVRALIDARQVCRLNLLHEAVPGPAPPPAGAPPLSAMLLCDHERARAALQAAMLEPLLAYDAAHGSELVHTLDVFLSTSGQWTASASQLGVHVNTLRYRLARIEKLTGRDLAWMGDRVDFFIALRARDAERAQGGTGSRTSRVVAASEAPA